MSEVRAKKFQIGNSGTAADNFLLYQPDVPDETIRLENILDGTDSLILGRTSIESTVPLLIPDGDTTNPGLAFGGDTDTGIYTTVLNNLGFTVGGSGKLSISSSSVATTVPLLSTIDGSSTAPVFSFASDSDTGMYRSGTNQLSFSAGGTPVFRLNSSTPFAEYWDGSAWAEVGSGGGSGSYLPLSGGTMTGDILLNGNDLSLEGGLLIFGDTGDGTNIDYIKSDDGANGFRFVHDGNTSNAGNSAMYFGTAYTLGGIFTGGFSPTDGTSGGFEDPAQNGQIVISSDNNIDFQESDASTVRFRFTMNDGVANFNYASGNTLIIPVV